MAVMAVVKSGGLGTQLDVTLSPNVKSVWGARPDRQHQGLHQQLFHLRQPALAPAHRPRAHGPGRRPRAARRPPGARAPAPKLEEATVLSTGHWEMVKRPDGAAFQAISRRARLYRTWGDCHGYFQVATGGADAMFDPVLKPWDICALVPVIEGAGRRATAIDGSDPVNGTDMLASRGRCMRSC